MTTTAAADEFEAHRPRLFGLAYRLPGSAADAVQDTYLRFSGADRTVIEQPGAWLAKVVTHLCLTPTEGAVYVLREAFAYGYREIAAVLDLTEADCRQPYRRAAGRVAVRFAGGLDFSVAEVNGSPALVARAGDVFVGTVSFAFRGGVVTDVRVVVNPDKLEFAGRQLMGT
ncbi:hypothetical protein [Streptomyces europaeiscabiei]|uniref:hypothetical protein n=1 Tax=Streptomyces europaeiscabiei TaxID=146819 RepID=UPI002E13D465|nr:hypothetical protein OHB30_40660 [Streptomyces europaeiscabiei]